MLNNPPAEHPSPPEHHHNQQRQQNANNFIYSRSWDCSFYAKIAAADLNTGSNLGIEAPFPDLRDCDSRLSHELHT